MGSPYPLPFPQPAVQPSGPRRGAEPGPGPGWMSTCGRNQVSRGHGTWAGGQAKEGLGVSLTGVSSALQFGRKQPGWRGPTFLSGAPTAQEDGVSRPPDHLGSWGGVSVALFWLSLTPGKAFEVTQASGIGAAWSKRDTFLGLPPCPTPWLLGSLPP